MLGIAIASIVLAAVAAYVQDDLEHVLGYSIVGDAGVVMLALATLDPEAWAPARTWILVFVVARSAFAAWVAGLPDPVAWAVLGFILNFIPYIGALIMEAGLFMVGLVTFPTLTHALLAPLLFLAFATLEGHFITPSIIGHRLTLNPLTVFLSLVFWTWLWGPVGAFLAVPLLIMALVVVDHLFPEDEPELPA